MKRRFLYVLCSLLIGSLLLSGCGQKPVEGLPMPQDGDLLKVGEDAYCRGNYPGIMGGTSTLYRIPQGERMPIPVCGKPGCQHNDSNCSAVYENSAVEGLSSLSSSVGFFRNRLYTLAMLSEQEIAVYSVDPETAERRLELTLNPQEVYDTGLSCFSITGVFHENSLILLYSNWETDGDTVSDPAYRMVVVDLATGKQKELFRSHFEEHIGTEYMFIQSDPVAVGNMVYLSENVPVILPDSDEIYREHRLSQFNLTTGEVTKLFCDNLVFTWQVEDEKIFFFDQAEARFKEFDLTTGELTVIPSEEGITDPSEEISDSPEEMTRTPKETTGVSYYLDDLIVHNAGEAYFDFQTSTLITNDWYEFYTRDYTQIDKLEYRDDFDALVFLFGTEEALYFRGDEDMYYLDRSEIGSHNLKLKPLT